MGEVYAAAYLLLVDSWLWIGVVHPAPGVSPFRHLAEVMRGSSDPPLRFAHCIRDVAYGDAPRTSDLVAMVNGNDPGYRRMFEEACWLPTSKEGRREQAKSGSSA